MDEMDEVISEFLIESYENLDRLDQDLLALEQDPRSPETLGSIFRTVHTIKGTCGFLGFAHVERLAHTAENMLGKLRDGELSFNPDIASALLRTGDVLRAMLGTIESTGADGEEDHAELVAELERLQDPTAPKASRAPKAPSRRRAGNTGAGGRGKAEDRAASDHEAASLQEPLADVPEADAAGLGDAPIREEAPAAVPAVAEEPAAPAPSPSEDAAAAGSAKGSVTDTSIRVDVGLLDTLMTLVGELVLARNQIVQLTAGTGDAALLGTSQRLNLITTELQEGVMKTRMQPIGSLWSKFPRVTRDLAMSFGKSVRLEMEGEDTELDRSILEAIKDPLTHLVRNAVDHGIESPEERRAAGKPEKGLLLVRAFHEGGQVNIEISDDGAGIDPASVRAKALERGLVSPDQVSRMGERELLDLIFLPGLTTSETVTNVSGRGVGMDVVRTNIERVGGNVDVNSRVGEGTTIKIKIPLTLAIIPALIVTSGSDRYAIPQVNLLELVRVEADDAERSIERIQGAPVYRLRGRLLPIVYLAKEIGQTSGDVDLGAQANIVVLQADDRQFGLVVEGVSDSAEIVVKPLGQHLKGISTFSGATIMGDGRVGLILDVMGLAQRAHVINEARERALAEAAAREQEALAQTATLLVFRTHDDGRMAVPLSMVDRLEEFGTTAIERSGPQPVVQYREEILPLLEVEGLLQERRRRRRTEAKIEHATDLVQVIVHSGEHGRVGLVVEEILDIVELRMELQEATRDGVLGTMVVNGRVTEVIDLAGVLRRAEVERRPLATVGG